ncbi:MAG: arabinogalactan oligomer/maltooligosaccharide transport system permease protein [Bradymonadia bacterium]
MRVVARFLLCCFAALLAVGCAGEDDAIDLWHSYRGDEATALLQVVEQFEAQHPDVDVRVLPVPYDVYANKITNGVPRGNGPDVFIFAQERTGGWAESGVVVPIDGWFDETVREPLPDNLQEAFVYGDISYGLPLATKTLALFSRTDLREGAPPETTDQLIAEAMAFTDRDEGRFGLVYQVADFYFHSGWFFGLGGSLEDPSGVPSLAGEANALSLDFASSLLNEHRILPRDPTGALVTELFVSGNALFAISGPWFVGELPEGTPYTVSPLPTISANGQPARPFVTVEGVLATAQVTEERRPQVIALMAFLAGEDSARIRAEVGHQAVAHETVVAEEGGDPVTMTFARAAMLGTPMPNRPEMQVFWEPANRALRQTLRGDVNAVDALVAADAELAEALAPPPPGANPTPYLALASLAMLGFCAWFVAHARRTGLVVRVRAQRKAYAYILPAAFASILLIFAPFVIGAVISLYSHEAGRFTFVGFANFVRILFDPDVTNPRNFYFTLVVTVMWTVLNVTFHVAIGLWLALLLRDPWVKLKGLYRVLLIVPWAVPNYITALIWRGMFNVEFGAINALLDVFGVERVDWFSQFATAFSANLITNTWLGFPFMMVVSLGALQSIPRDLEDAAAIDGANRWQQFRHVTLPLLRPTLVPAVILGSVWTFNMFNIIYLVSGGEPDSSSDILITEAYRWAFERQERYGYAAAYGVLIFGALLLYTALTTRRAPERS